MKLYLVQHGETCSKEVNPERPLTDQGELDIDRLAVFFEKAGIRVECVIHSGKLRAEQTAERLAKMIAPEVEPETSGRMNPTTIPQHLTGKAKAGTEIRLSSGIYPLWPNWFHTW